MGSQYKIIAYPTKNRYNKNAMRNSKGIFKPPEKKNQKTIDRKNRNDYDFKEKL